MFLSRERSITFLFLYKSVGIKIQGHWRRKQKARSLAIGFWYITLRCWRYILVSEKWYEIRAHLEGKCTRIFITKYFNVTSKSRLIFIGLMFKKCAVCKCLDETFDFVVDKLNFRRDLIKSIHCRRGEVTHPCATHTLVIIYHCLCLLPTWFFFSNFRKKQRWKGLTRKARNELWTSYFL